MEKAGKAAAMRQSRQSGQRVNVDCVNAEANDEWEAGVQGGDRSGDELGMEIH